MIINVILGVNIDTPFWISNLKENNSDQIVVLDYDYFGEPIMREEILFLSSYDLEKILKKFDTINFYKSMYVYPGIFGNMSSSNIE